MSVYNLQVGKTRRRGDVVWIEFTVKGYGFMLAF